jgi:hypothetical protein
MSIGGQGKKMADGEPLFTRMEIAIMVTSISYTCRRERKREMGPKLEFLPM